MNNKLYLILFFLLSSVVSIESNITKYKIDYLDKWQPLNAVYLFFFDAFQVGAESWWIIFPYFVLVYLLYNRTKNEGLTGMVSFLFLVVFNGFFPRVFLFVALIFYAFLFAVSFSIARSMIGE